MKTFLVYVLLFLSFVSITKSQDNKPYLEESKPLSPAAYQFLKYTALPVSEYTGIPEVSVPIYEITEDGVHVPVSLNYHASGITVNEEATSVGLGWNLQFGSIVQIVNDQNDLNPKNTKLIPDYIGSSIPSVLPIKYPWPWETPGGPTYFPVGNVYADYRFPITTSYYCPVNGDYTIDRTQLLISPDYDSEPDIFKANFLGFSLNFIKDFKNGGQIVVLNKAGYRVEYLNDDSWRITVPSGDQYYFALKNVTSSTVSSSTKTVISPNGNPSYSVNDESSVMWSLTKIITKNKKEIDFNYTQTNSYPHIPNFSQTWKKARVLQARNVGWNESAFPAFWYYDLSTDDSGNLTTNIFTQSEPHIVPSSIVFPLGRVDFYSSDRDDVLGGKKIDSITVNGDQLHKVFRLNYSYLNSSAVGGSGFPYDYTPFGNSLSLRLKLDSFVDNTGGVYQFNYDPTQLPNKNSFAQDQWGYYNGSLTNTSLIPNPTQYNKPELGNNGDNHSANEPYAKACSLIQIIYPTGGSVNFDFELNSFSNYWVPDYTTSSNTVSHGNGLRVRQIIWKLADNTISKIQKFEYSDGKALMPINLYRNYEHPTGTGYYNNDFGTNAYFGLNTYFVDEFNANGYYSPSSLAAITGVGYTQVTSKSLDQSNNSTGSVTTTFSNNVTILPNNSVQYMTRVNISVPGRENMDVPKNGSTLAVRYFDQQGNIQKKSSTAYTNVKSSLFYGARIYGYGNYIFYVPPAGLPGFWSSKPQFMFAEYPIYDFESLPDTVTDVDYSNTNDSLVTSTVLQYNSDRLLTYSVKSGTNYKEKVFSVYSSLPAMRAENRLSDLTYRSKSLITNNVSLPDRLPTSLRSFNRTFVQIGDKWLPSQDEERNVTPSVSYTTSSVTYDLYDDAGNVSQLRDKTGITSLIWGYNRKYLIAKIFNADYATIQSVLGASNITSFTALTAPADASVVSFLSALRSDARLKDAHITTYTYKPLVGLSSETDPKGKSIFYEYDNVQRLKNIKDQNGNVLKNYGYHLIGQ